MNQVSRIRASMSVLMSGSKKETKLHTGWSRTTRLISMRKTKKAAKYIVKNPDLFTVGEQAYAELILKAKKLQKKAKKQNEQRKTDLGDT